MVNIAQNKSKYEYCLHQTFTHWKSHRKVEDIGKYSQTVGFVSGFCWHKPKLKRPDLIMK